MNIPHNHRNLGDRVLVTHASGRYVFLSDQEYRDFLRGRLQPEGFSRPPDREALANEELQASLLSWTGPSRHILFLSRGKRLMSLETAKDAVDFAFSASGLGVDIEVAGGDAGQWPCLWFIVQYAERKSEWTKRPVRLSLRVARVVRDAEKAEFLRKHSVELLVSLEIKGRPRDHEPIPPGGRLMASVGARAESPRSWIDVIEAAGIEWVRLSPAPELMTEKGMPRFLDFYGRALSRMIAGKLREERAASFLSRRRWRLPGQDLLSELAYDPGGAIYASEAAMSLEDGPDLFCLGALGRTQYHDLAQSDVVRAVIGATQSEIQPLCFQCAYNPYCSIPPTMNFKLQGTLWGQTPSSPACSLHMGILDLIFGRLAHAEDRRVLETWASSSR